MNLTDVYEEFLDAFDDIVMAPLIKERLKDVDDAIEVDIDDL